MAGVVGLGEVENAVITAEGESAFFVGVSTTSAIGSGEIAGNTGKFAFIEIWFHDESGERWLERDG